MGRQRRVETKGKRKQQHESKGGRRHGLNKEGKGKSKKQKAKRETGKRKRKKKRNKNDGGWAIRATMYKTGRANR